MQKMLESRIAPLALAVTFALLATATLPWAGAGPIAQDPHRSFDTTSEKEGSAFNCWNHFTVAISPGGDDVLSGSQTDFYATAGTGSDVITILGWTWSLGANAPGVLSSTEGATATFLASSVTNPTTTEVTVQVEGVDMTLGNAVCLATASVPIQVAPLLVAGPITTNQNPVAPGSQVDLSFTLTGGLPPMTVTWTFGDGASATVGAPADGAAQVDHVYPEGTYTPTATILDRAGESYDTSASSTLVVTSGMAASLSAPFRADVGNPVLVTASVSGGAPPYTFHWSDSAGSTSFNLDSWDLTPADPGTLEVYLTVTDSLQENALAAPVTLEVNPAPSLGISSLVQAHDDGTPFPLEIRLVGGTPPYQVSWADQAQDASFASTFTAPGTYAAPYSFSQTGDVVLDARVIDADSVQASSVEMVGEVVPQPMVSLEVFPSSPTVGSALDLTGTVAGGVAPYTYAFLFSGSVSSTGPTSGTLSAPGTVTWNGALTSPIPDIVTLDITDSGGGSTTSSLTISAAGALRAAVTIAPERGEVGLPLTAMVSVTGGVAPYSYSISGSDGESLSGLLQDTGGTAVQLLPSLAGNLTYSLSLFDAVGRSTRASSTVVVAPPLDTFLEWSPTTVDLGDTLNVTVTPGGGWAPYSGTLSTSTGATYFLAGLTGSTGITLPAPTVGPLRLTATLTDALGATASRGSTVHVNPWPTARLLVSPATTEVGLPVTFSTSVSGGTPAFVSTIYFGDGRTAPSSQAVHTYARAGTYLANATVRDAAGAVVSTATLEVVVEPTPQVFASASPPSTDVGLGTAFSSTVTFGTSPFSYRWSFGDGGGSADADPTHTYLVAGLYHVSLQVTDSLGETNSSEELSLAVSPAPTVDLVTNRTTTDVGQPISFEALPLGGSLPFTFRYNFGDGESAWGANATHAYRAGGTYEVSVSLTDGAGETTSTFLSVQVGSVLLAPTVGETPSVAEVGTPILLTGTPVGGIAPYRLSWNLEGQHANTTDSEGWSFDPSQPGTYSGTVTLEDATGLSVSTSFSLRVAPSLALNFSLPGMRAEAGVPATLGVGISGGVAPYSLVWTLPSGKVMEGNTSTLALIPTVAGPMFLSVSVTDSLGAVASQSELLDVAPALSLTLPPSPIEADAGILFSLPMTVSGGIGAINLSVRTPGGSGAGSLTLLFTAPGTYPVTVTASDAAGALSILGTNVTVVQSLSISLQGNPTTVPTGTAERYLGQVSGGVGPLRETWAVPGMSGWQGDSVNLSFPAAGTYPVTFTVADRAGDSEIVLWNVTAVVDRLNVSLNASVLTGLSPFAPPVTLVVRGGNSPVNVDLSLNGEEMTALVDRQGTWEWWGMPVLSQPGSYDLEAQATDALGERSNASLLLTACTPLASPSLEPFDPSTTAGTPLALTLVENQAPCPGAVVDEHWWGPDLLSRDGTSVTFLSNSTGGPVDHVSILLRLLDGNVLENLTIPILLTVRAGPAIHAVLAGGRTVGLAGDNVSLLYQATDAFGNVNTTANGTIRLLDSMGTGDPISGTFGEGSAYLRWSEVQAGWQNFTVQATFDAPSILDVLWEANPDRALLTVQSLEAVGSDLVVNVSVLDIYGNPLSNVTVEAVTPGSSPAFANATGGWALLVVKGGADAPSVTVRGPNGATTSVTVNPAVGGGGDSLVPTLVGAALFAVALALFLLWVRRRREKGSQKPERTLQVLTRLLAEWPDEDRDSLLAMAEESHVTPEEASAGLATLEGTGKAIRTVDEEGVERWKPAGSIPPEEGERVPTGPAADLEEETEGTGDEGTLEEAEK